jgi:hypothetical protein
MDDYKYRNTPIEPEFVTYQNGYMFQYIFRISFKCGDNMYIPMSFIVDTGTVSDFLLSDEAMHILQKHNLLSKDSKLELCDENNAIYHATVQKINKKHARVNQSNYIGIRFIQKFGFIVKEKAFRFERHFQYF